MKEMQTKRIPTWKILVATVAANLLAVIAQAALDPPHTGTVGCLSCHQMTSTYPKLLPPLNHTPLPGDLDDTVANGTCWSCHNDPIPPECSGCHPSSPAPYVSTHSSLTTSTKHGNWTVECWVCHNQHMQEQDRYNASTYGKYIRQSINLANIKGEDGNTFPGKSGIKSVVFKGQTGPNSFADGDATYNGICEVCHTATTAWQNNGDYSNQGAHKGLKAKNCIPCHPHTEGFKADYKCLDCHADPSNTEANITRTNVKEQFINGSSHHVQRFDDENNPLIENTDCYQCHWEADEAGKVTSHHGASPDAAVDLVIYDSNNDGLAGSRPTAHSIETAIAYTADGSRSEIEKINNHCLGCHNDDLKEVDVFSDGKSTNYYAWDGTCDPDTQYNGQKSACISNGGEWTPGTSVAKRYSQINATDKATWGKYTDTLTTNIASKQISKAYSAHGNAGLNQQGWDPTNGVDGAISDATGNINVACFDCHNSHGSTAGKEGVDTYPTTSYASATIAGGILKDTVAGKSGYAVTYKPLHGGTSANKNIYNPGAALCFDCHLTQAGVSRFGYETPWGYQSTYQASQPIIGYYDAPYFAPGTAGPQVRYPYKALISGTGGHFWASSRTDNQNSGMSSTPMHNIGGLCTPCHDPHGVSPTLDTNRKYGVPLLKGTWVTSPYLEDVAPANNGYTTNAFVNSYHIDQNTFGSDILGLAPGNLAEDDSQFAGLCLQCHPKDSLTDGQTHTWKSKDRIHESVKGWKTANTSIQHRYTCSKCHKPHNGSSLPRLLITNCLNGKHKGRMGNNTAPLLASGGADGVDGCGGGEGWGNIPGSYYSDDDGNITNHLVTCHDGQTGSAIDQSWNVKSEWTAFVTSPSATAITDTTATLGAAVTADGGAPITERGTVWGTSALPSDNALAQGGTATGSFTHGRTGLPAGTKIYYRGYARNDKGVTSFSPDGSFYTEPAAQASDIYFTAVGGNDMTVNWTRGSGAGAIVLMRQGSAVTSNPNDGSYTSYIANASFGSGTQIGAGNYVVYKGTGTSVTLTNLIGGTTYYVAVYEYSGTVNSSGANQGTNYKTGPAAGNQQTAASVPNLTSPSVLSIADTTATLQANVTADGGAAITERGTVWSTSAAPTTADNKTTTTGTTGLLSTDVSGLPAGTRIYYRGYALNNSGTGYSPEGSFYTEPATQAGNVNFTAVELTSMTVNWTRGSGTEVIVLMRQDAAVTSNPSDGTYTYSANAAFGSGSPIGAGNYVVYKGVGTSVTVTGLLPGNTTYHVAVFEYAGTVNTSGVHLGTNYKPIPAVGSHATSATEPSLISPTATSITDSTALLGANVTSDHGSTITERGTVWNTTGTPTTADNTTTTSGTTGLLTTPVSGLPPGTRIYYRGYAINGLGTGYSSEGSFYTEPASQAANVTFTAVSSTGMTVNWTRGAGDGVIVLLQQGAAVAGAPTDGTYTTYSANTVFESGTRIGAAYVLYKGSGTSVAVTGLSSGTTYHVAVYEYKGTVDTSGVHQGTNYKSTPATGSQLTSGAMPPAAPTLNHHPEYDSGCADTPVTVTWGAVTAPDSHSAEYYVEVYFACDPSAPSCTSPPALTSDWISATSFNFTATAWAETWWRVRARDSVHPEAYSPWSTPDHFWDIGSTCSCPMLYTWDGTSFAFERDIYGPGKLGLKTAGGYAKPNPYDYYLLKNEPARRGDGSVELRVVEERSETDYLDRVGLYTVDMPADREVYAENITFDTGSVVDLSDILHTTATDLRQPSSIAHLNTGDDVSAVLSASDEDTLLLNEDKNDFVWHTLEIDLGDLSQAPMIKLILDAVSVYPTTPEGFAKANALSDNADRTKLEVLDGEGNWVLVPRETVVFSKPKEFPSPYIVDISNIFLTNNYTIRLSFLYKTYVDAILFDTTADAPLSINEVPLAGAALVYYGASAKIGNDEVYSYAYGVQTEREYSYMTGNYTRYGDVGSLLTAMDDKFVIFAGGDELQLKFNGFTAQPQGTSRRYLFNANGYYKGFKKNSEVTWTVAPLPFNAMSNFPYDETVEHYPDDAEHLHYLETYNTREK